MYPSGTMNKTQRMFLSWLEKPLSSTHRPSALCVQFVLYHLLENLPGEEAACMNRKQPIELQINWDAYNYRWFLC